MKEPELPVAYRRLIGAQPLLDAETERSLARRFKASGSAEARDRLVASHLRLVVKIAHEYRWSNQDLADLVQEGSLGLVLALRRYDPDRGVRLSSYAAWWIRACMLRLIVDNWRLVRVGTTVKQRKVMTRVRKERATLERDGEPVDAAKLAQRVGVSEEGLAELEHHVRSPELSLDAEHEGGARVVSELAGPETDRPDVLIEDLDQRRAIARAARELEAGLSTRERSIFRARWLGPRPVTLQQMGDKFGISRERARQLEERTLAKLRALLEVRLAA
jgi:RNA polymerase sigma-32 factor